MKGIVTVLGKDQVGIIAQVCAYLADKKINILDISQTIVSGYFNMMMVVDLSTAANKLDVTVDELKKLGESIGVDIRLQREEIFNSMHKI